MEEPKKQKGIAYKKFTVSYVALFCLNLFFGASIILHFFVFMLENFFNYSFAYYEISLTNNLDEQNDDKKLILIKITIFLSSIWLLKVSVHYLYDLLTLGKANSSIDYLLYDHYYSTEDAQNRRCNYLCRKWILGSFGKNNYNQYNYFCGFWYLLSFVISFMVSTIMQDGLLTLYSFWFSLCTSIHIFGFFLILIDSYIIDFKTTIIWTFWGQGQTFKKLMKSKKGIFPALAFIYELTTIILISLTTLGALHKLGLIVVSILILFPALFWFLNLHEKYAYRTNEEKYLQYSHKKMGEYENDLEMNSSSQKKKKKKKKKKKNKKKNKKKKKLKNSSYDTNSNQKLEKGVLSESDTDPELDPNPESESESDPEPELNQESEKDQDPESESDQELVPEKDQELELDEEPDSGSSQSTRSEIELKKKFSFLHITKKETKYKEQIEGLKNKLEKLKDLMKTKESLPIHRNKKEIQGEWNNRMLKYEYKIRKVLIGIIFFLVALSSSLVIAQLNSGSDNLSTVIFLIHLITFILFGIVSSGEKLPKSLFIKESQIVSIVALIVLILTIIAMSTAMSKDSNPDEESRGEIPFCTLLDAEGIDSFDLLVYTMSAYHINFPEDFEKILDSGIGERWRDMALTRGTYFDSWFSLYDSTTNTHYVAVSGTAYYNFATIITDTVYFSGVAAYQMANFIYPFLDFTSANFMSNILLIHSRIIEFFYPYSNSFYDEIFDYLHKIINNADLDNPPNIYVMGHSLGGGISQLVGNTFTKSDLPDPLYNKLKVFTFNSPGIFLSRKKFARKNYTITEETINRNTYNFKVMGDIVGYVDRPLGNIQNLVCKESNILSCHSLVNTIKNLWEKCQKSGEPDFINALSSISG
ncbi:zcchc10 protein [Anaeramoeba flamelloides]|uniref:Zcchc10 protein n=1 Tax=Anaeramoeba flamelloides TaxID=1746091 RepID=A0AAV7YRG3_9EUKA|nr:zcchc10 protein [Anaeramoeba flamelloides]